MIKDVFDATRTLDLAVGRLELQRDVRSRGFERRFTNVISDCKSIQKFG